MPRDLIVLAEDWGGLPTSTQHIIRHLPGKRRILWVNSVGIRRPRLNRHDMARLVHKAKTIVQGNGKPATGTATLFPVEMPEGMEVLSPRVIPWPGLNMAYKINKRLIRNQLGQRAAAMGLENPHLWIAFPTGLIALDAGLHDRAVYYCADDYGAIEGVDHRPALEMERVLVDRVDRVIATSDVLADKFPAEKTSPLPHGVDIEKFQTPAPRARDMPTDKKVAGFYGSFLNRIDVGILRKAALDLPDWEFVFIGRVERGDRQELALDNVTFYGSRPHGELAGYVQHWTVSLLPFRDCAMVRAMNPLKLREYLAAGTPVASVEFPALAPYRDLVSVSSSRDTFSAAILQAASDGARNGKRRESVAGESWQQCGQKAHDILEAL